MVGCGKKVGDCESCGDISFSNKIMLCLMCFEDCDLKRNEVIIIVDESECDF